MSAIEALAKILLVIEDGTVVGKNGTDYEDPKMTLATISDILADNPIEYKYRVVNKLQKFKTFPVGTLTEAEMMMEEKGDSIQRKPLGSRWEDI